MNKLLIKKILKERRIKYSELAEMTGLSRHTINMYLNDKTSIRPEREKSILDVLGLNVEALEEMEKSGMMGYLEKSWYRTTTNTDEIVRKMTERIAYLENKLQYAEEKLELYDRMLRVMESKIFTK